VPFVAVGLGGVLDVHDAGPGQVQPDIMPESRFVERFVHGSVKLDDRCVNVAPTVGVARVRVVGVIPDARREEHGRTILPASARGTIRRSGSAMRPGDDMPSIRILTVEDVEALVTGALSDTPAGLAEDILAVDWSGDGGIRGFVTALITATDEYASLTAEEYVEDVGPEAGRTLVALQDALRQLRAVLAETPQSEPDSNSGRQGS
jgi:hypothetical protein